ncbi:hypothetical protein AJ88_33735 [Mesorhizobium amorphae CCBAU 01583]|nr:hypothetical protein AJ88_33735 [Mesorhizobium amorphae CCBAU 01583]
MPFAIGSQCSSSQHCFSYQLSSCADANGIPKAQAAAMIAPNPDAPQRPLHGQIMIYIRLV